MEGLSLALLDAMGAAVCVLTSDIPENREVIGNTGLTFRAGDATDLARMLRQLLADAPLRAAMGRSAQARVREHYLWPGIAEEIGRSYVQLTGRITQLRPSKTISPSAAEETRQSLVS